MGLKGLVLLLVLILVLFAALLFFGVRRSDSNNSDAEDTLHSLSDSFVSKEPLSPLSISSKCFNNPSFVVPIGRPCAANVIGSNAMIRTMKLLISEGARGRLHVAPRGSQAVPIDLEIPSANTNNSRQTPEIQILKDGADLSLVCEASAMANAPCSFRLNP